MESPLQALGAAGEALAAHYLGERGYKILLKNYECALGEIDLIAKEAGRLVFVEVKTRRSQSMGPPAEAVTWQKRRQIVRVAQFYIKRYGIGDVPCRFDVVSVCLEEKGGPVVEVLKDAFGEEG